MKRGVYYLLDCIIDWLFKMHSELREGTLPSAESRLEIIGAVFAKLETYREDLPEDIYDWIYDKVARPSCQKGSPESLLVALVEVLDGIMESHDCLSATRLGLRQDMARVRKALGWCAIDKFPLRLLKKIHVACDLMSCP